MDTLHRPYISQQDHDPLKEAEESLSKLDKDQLKELLDKVTKDQGNSEQKKGEEEGADNEGKARTIELVSYLKKELGERVSDVVESNRLTDSPCVLTVPSGGMGLNMERIMKMTDQEFAETKRVLEINPGHPIIRNMGQELSTSRGSGQLKDWSQFLVDYVLLTEGTVEDPQRVTKTLQSIMTKATEQAAT